MLTQLIISNFVIVRELKINLQSGIIAITGEIGDSKSIAINALELSIGNRADSNVVCLRGTRSDICAHFFLTDTPSMRI